MGGNEIYIYFLTYQTNEGGGDFLCLFSPQWGGEGCVLVIRSGNIIVGGWKSQGEGGGRLSPRGGCMEARVIDIKFVI